jgi:hypothetical protein
LIAISGVVLVIVKLAAVLWRTKSEGEISSVFGAEETEEEREQDKKDIDIIMDDISKILDDEYKDIRESLTHYFINQELLPIIRRHLLARPYLMVKRSRLCDSRRITGNQFQELENNLRENKKKSKHLNMRNEINKEELKPSSIFGNLKETLERNRDDLNNPNTHSEMKIISVEIIMTTLGDIAYYRYMKTNFLTQFTTNCNVS